MILMSWETSMPLEERWETVVDMVQLAPNERCLGDIAAGPLESLLVRYGDETFELLRQEVARNSKFARTLKRVWKCTMTDEFWSKLQFLLK